MRVHRNAKTTPMARAPIVQRVDAEGWTVAETAEAFGVSTRTVHKWRARLRTEDLRGLEDRRSVPARIPHRTQGRRVAAILRLRAQRWPQHAIARRLSMPRPASRRTGDHDVVARLLGCWCSGDGITRFQQPAT